MLKYLVLITAIFHSAWGAQYNLHHRVFVPGKPSDSSKYALKGTVDIDTTTGSSFAASFTPVPTKYDQLLRDFQKSIDEPHALYQVALELPDYDENMWPMTSIKACHLPKASGERIWVHVSHAGIAHALSYWLMDTPDDGTCPPSLSPVGARGEWNSTVIVKSSLPAPVPQLRVPPPLTPEGNPVVPEVEKTFIQKYWMHLIGGFLLISFLAPIPEEEGQSGQQQQGSSAGSK